MNTRANAAGRIAKTAQTVGITNPPEYEVPTEGANGVSAKVIDWPDTDRAPTIVEIAGVRFTRGSEQVTVIGRIGPGGHNGGQVVAAEIGGTILVRAKDPEEIRRQALLDAIGDELEALMPADQRDHASRLLGEFEMLWGGRVNDVHDYVLRQVGIHSPGQPPRCAGPRW
jgi:hypothetical protein